MLVARHAYLAAEIFSGFCNALVIRGHDGAQLDAAIARLAREMDL